MAIVPDSSVIVSQAFDDEDANYAEAAIATIAAEEAIVPTLFWFEIRNALIMGERRKRLTPDRTAAFLAALGALPIAIDDTPDEQSVLDLARRHTLTVYDATYLELAIRKNSVLATLDEALRKAAKNAGVVVLEGSTKSP